MRIYFIRHSETDCNKNHLFYGSLDVPVNETGATQADRLAALLEDVRFDRIYASDMLRVHQTLDIVLKRNKAAQQEYPPVIVLPEIREIDFGLWEGKTYDEISKAYPDDVAKWCNDWENSTPTGGESFRHFISVRIKKAFFDIISDALAHGMTEKTVLIASHNGVMQSMFAAIMNLELKGVWHFQFEQDAYSVVDFECDNYTVRKINSREHAK